MLADVNYLVRGGIHRLLETQDDLEVVATCGDLESLLEAVEAERPDVVVTDIRMPPSGRPSALAGHAPGPGSRSRSAAQEGKHCEHTAVPVARLG